MGYIGSDPKNNESVSTSQLVDDSVTNAKIVDNVLFTSVTSSIVSASGNITADTFTGTFNGALSSSAQIATSISGSSTSLSSSLSTRATTLESASGSFASDLVTLKGSGTVQGVGTSDSPTFADTTITGTLTAQEVHTEFESASVIFTSGSTIFGNSSDDIHNMTGSLNVSGGLDVVGTTNLDVVDIDGAVDMASTLKAGNTILGQTGNQKGKLTIQSRTGTAARKTNAIVAIPYNDTSESICMIGMDGQAGNNEMHIGSNTSDFMSPTYIDFFTAANVNSQTNSRVMRMTSEQKVGIATDSPTLLLHVNGGALIRNGSDAGSYFDHTNTNTLNFGYDINSNTGGWVNYKGYQGGTTQFRDFYVGDGKGSVVAIFEGSTSRVGIGTNDPGYQLDIQNTDHAVMRLLAGTDKSASLRLKNNAQDWDVNCQTNDNFAIYDQTGGAAALTIEPSNYNASFTGTIQSVQNQSGDYANVAFLTSQSGNGGVKISHGGGNGKLEIYGGNQSRTQFYANQITANVNGLEIKTTDAQSLTLGTNNTTRLTIDSSGNATFTSMVKSSLFRTDNQATSVANATWTDLNGLTNLTAGLYIIHAYKDNYAANDWSARGIVEATGHSTIDGDFENQSGFQLRVNGNDVQLYHTLGTTFGITVAWIKIG